MTAILGLSVGGLRRDLAGSVTVDAAAVEAGPEVDPGGAIFMTDR